MKTQAVFAREEACYSPCACEITKVVTLTDGDYEYFKKHLMNQYDFLQNNQQYMGYGESGVRCLLVTGVNSGDGILVNSEGAKYARYTAFFPESAEYLKAHASELTEKPPGLRVLNQDEVAIMQARHTLWQYEQEGGEQADFSGCYLSNVDFRNMQFNGACFRGAVLEDCDLSSAGMCFCDFSEAKLIHCKANDLAAEECNFSGAAFVDSAFINARMANSNFAGTTMENTNLWGANLNPCSMDEFEQEENQTQESSEQDNMTERCWERDETISMCMGGM